MYIKKVGGNIQLPSDNLPLQVIRLSLAVLFCTALQKHKRKVWKVIMVRMDHMIALFINIQEELIGSISLLLGTFASINLLPFKPRNFNKFPTQLLQHSRFHLSFTTFDFSHLILSYQHLNLTLTVALS